jgi:hypothetical protein
MPDALPTEPPLDRFPYPRDPASRPFGPDLPAGQYVFVQAADGVVWVLPETRGHLHPRVRGGAEPAAAAGGLLLGDGGVILEVDNFSGTFQFGPDIFPAVRAALAAQGADVSAAREVPFGYD